MSQHPGRVLFLAVLCIPTALQPSPRLGSTLPKGGWHNDSPSKVSAIGLSRKRLTQRNRIELNQQALKFEAIECRRSETMEVRNH